MGGLSQCCLARCSSVLISREYIKATIGKRDQLNTQIGPEEPNPESSDYEIRANHRKKSRFFIKTFLEEFRLKLNFAHQTTSCTYSQGALFITLQLTTLLYRQTPLPLENAPCHSALYPSNECELGPCRSVCSVYTTGWCKGRLQCTCNFTVVRKRRGSGKLEAAAISYVNHAA